MTASKPKPRKPARSLDPTDHYQAGYRAALRYVVRELRRTLKDWGYSEETSEELFILARRFEREARAVGRKK